MKNLIMLFPIAFFLGFTVTYLVQKRIRMREARKWRLKHELHLDIISGKTKYINNKEVDKMNLKQLRVLRDVIDIKISKFQ